MLALRPGRAASVGLVAALLATAAAALAGDGPDATALAKAREQFRQAISLETAGNWGGALALLREVSSVKATPQVRFNIAICEEHLGQLATAIGDYELTTADARESGANDVAGEATARLEALRGRIPKLVVLRGAGAELAKISVDGVALGGAMVGQPIPVDPGPHGVEATAAGKEPFRATIELAENESKSVEVVLVPVAVPKPATDRATPRASGEAKHAKAETAAPPSASTLPWIVGGAGAASLVASGVFFALRSAAISDLDGSCGPSRDACPASSQATYDRGKTYTTVADVTLALGVVGVGAGAVLYFTAPSGAASSTALTVTPSANGAAAALSTRF